MDLSQRLSSLGQRFLSMRQDPWTDERGLQYMVTRVEVDFASGNSRPWKVFGMPHDCPPNKQIIRVSKRDAINSFTKDDVYIVFSLDPKISFEALLQHVQTIFDINKQMDQKASLIEIKNKEFIQLVSDLSYAELQSLEFKYKPDKKPKVKKEEAPPPQEETNKDTLFPEIVVETVQKKPKKIKADKTAKELPVVDVSEIKL